MVVCGCEEVRLETGPTALAPFVSCRTVRTPGPGFPPVRTAEGGGLRRSSDYAVYGVPSPRLLVTATCELLESSA
jgi:hypothetical protein